MFSKETLMYAMEILKQLNAEMQSAPVRDTFKIDAGDMPPAESQQSVEQSLADHPVIKMLQDLGVPFHVLVRDRDDAPAQQEQPEQPKPEQKPVSKHQMIYDILKELGLDVKECLGEEEPEEQEDQHEVDSESLKIVYVRGIGMCDVVEYTKSKRGKTRYTVVDIEGNRHTKVRPKDTLDCSERFVPECVYVAGDCGMMFTKGSMENTVHKFTDNVGLVDKCSEKYMWAMQGVYDDEDVHSLEQLIAAGVLNALPVHHVRKIQQMYQKPVAVGDEVVYRGNGERGRVVLIGDTHEGVKFLKVTQGDRVVVDEANKFVRVY